MSDGVPPKHRAKVPGREPLRQALPKRFYKEVSSRPAATGFQILLDGRSIRTPGKRQIIVPTAALATALAEEWQAQKKLIDPATMPLSRIVNTAIDAVADNLDEVAADIVAFAGSDLLCYRAEGPQDLIARQQAAWDPVLSWAANTLGARFLLREGIMPLEQPRLALDRIEAALPRRDAFRLASVHVMTTLTGSALLALARAAGQISLDDAWSASHVDEDFQIEQWGQDGAARERRVYRKTEFAAASRLLSLLDSD